MGLLNYIPFLGKSDREHLTKLPAGSFTLDANGTIVSSTLPQSFPAAKIKEIGRCVTHAFQNARKARMHITELHIHFSTLKVTAKEMKGSAVVFITPQTLEESSY